MAELKSYINEELFSEIPYGCEVHVRHSTNVTNLANGCERRNANWAVPKREFKLDGLICNEQRIAQIVEFFQRCQGMANAFLFRDITDHSCYDQVIGHGNGVQKSFQLVKYYGSVRRAIAKPVEGSVRIVQAGSVLAKEDYSVDYETGIVNLAVAPAEQQEIVASFDFYILVRFMNDTLKVIVEGPNRYSLADLELIEVK